VESNAENGLLKKPKFEFRRRRLYWGLFTLGILLSVPFSELHAQISGDVLYGAGESGQAGGRLVASWHSEPKTLNPVTAVDIVSKELAGLLNADLIHINLATQQTEPALAKSWTVSPDGKHYTLELRRGLRFSDGQSFDADDVVFSFKVYLDAKTHSSQRDLLEVGGKPIQVQKLGPYRVQFDLPSPYAAAERIFDGVDILPRHLLEATYNQGQIDQAWGLSSAPATVAGLGPFRLRQYTPGQQVVLERNPYYWKVDAARHRLPYIDELAFLIVPTEDAEVIRFQAGDLDVLEKISADNYAVLEREQRGRGYHLFNLGPGLEYDFLFFNLNDLSAKHLPTVAKSQEWFRRKEFRQAVSLAIDRDAIVRLVYRGRATPIWTQVTPGNKLWVDPAIPHPARSVEKAAALLRGAGFSRRSDGTLVDAHGEPVEFSILTNPSNAQRTKMATLIQDDLGQLGMRVHLVSMEFQALMGRVFDSFDYEATLLGLVSGDADPNPEINVWTSTGGTHVWALAESHPLAPWQSELDKLMDAQTTLLDFPKRKEAYDRVQQIVADEDPVICLVSPNILAGAKDGVAGLAPSVMRNYLLWNAERLYWHK
jgi:peptide/nickel transport system substrate-binding protein